MGQPPGGEVKAFISPENTGKIQAGARSTQDNPPPPKFCLLRLRKKSTPMSSVKKRLERLERAQPKGAPIILVENGETEEQTWQKHLAEHPEHADAKGVIIITISPLGPLCPSTPNAGTATAPQGSGTRAPDDN